jgi:hypothetical protein
VFSRVVSHDLTGPVGHETLQGVVLAQIHDALGALLGQQELGCAS